KEQANHVNGIYERGSRLISARLTDGKYMLPIEVLSDVDYISVWEFLASLPQTDSIDIFDEILL
ncbi:MAG TPA: hypothetical protein PKI15_10840, partial [Candidatus Cloacimonadota bacterium]|nr:hypothetical protein [Candidatus Cloacimonadota bacterium]